METTVVYLPKHRIFQWTVFKEAFDSDEGLQFELIGEDKNFWTLTTSSDLNTVLAVKSITLLLKDSNDPITIETNFQENPNQPSQQETLSHKVEGSQADTFYYRITFKRVENDEKKTFENEDLKVALIDKWKRFTKEDLLDISTELSNFDQNGSISFKSRSLGSRRDSLWHHESEKRREIRIHEQLYHSAKKEMYLAANTPNWEVRRNEKDVAATNLEIVRCKGFSIDALNRVKGFSFEVAFCIFPFYGLDSAPIVPRTPFIYQTLPSLHYDILTITPTENLRRAFDELTLGLHWYVLFTMIHSAAPLADARNRRKKIEFRYSNASVPRTNRSGFYQKTGKVSIDVTNTRNIWESMKNYADAFNHPSVDLRQLIQHVKSVNRGSPREEYYLNGVYSAAKNVHDCAIYFAHHNSSCLFQFQSERQYIGVAPSRHILIQLREEAAAVESVGHVQELLNNIRTRKSLESDIATTAFINSDVAQICREVLRCAFEHFKSVKMILSMFTRLYPELLDSSKGFKQIQKVMPITACADIKQICESLKEETETFDGEGFMRPNAQFVLTRLWAQFSIRNTDHNDIVERVMSSEADTERNINLTYLRGVLVNRFKIIEINGTNFQINTSSHKKANPTTVTHLDIINRLITLTGRTLNIILFKAANNYDDNPSVASKGSIYSSVIAAIETIKKIPLVASAIGGKPFPIKFSEKKINKDRAPETRLLGIQERRSDFIQRDPHWADPRFIGELLNENRSDNTLTRMGKDILGIRDQASHYLNLIDPISMTQNMIESYFETLLQHVHTLSTELVVPCDDIDEYRALLELYYFIPHYFRFRGRENITARIEEKDKDNFRRYPSECLEGIINSIERYQLLPPVEKYGAEIDGSFESLQRLLPLVCERDVPPVIIVEEEKKISDGKKKVGAARGQSRFSSLFEDDSD